MRRFAFCTGVVLLLSLATAQGQWFEKIRINGYSSFEYELMLSDSGNGDPNGSFDVDLFDIVLNIQATDRLRLQADVTWEHGVASEDGRGNAALEYAFSEYTIENWLRIRAGKMFIPFGIYNEIHVAKPAFISVKEPLSTNKPDKMGLDHRFYPRWGTGISFTGDFFIDNMDFDYNLQISNGENETTNPFEEDDNFDKAITARLRSNILSNLRAGVSMYHDIMRTVPDTAGKRNKILSLGGYLEYNVSDVALEAEIVSSSWTPGTGSTLSSMGASVMASYLVGSKITPYLRYEYLDPNGDVDKDEATIYVYGVNTRIDEQLFFKLEFDTVSPQDKNGGYKLSGLTKAKGYTELKAAIAVGF